MFEDMTVARPYAKAIFDFAVKKNNLNHWKNFLKLLTKISNYSEIKIITSEIYPIKIRCNFFFSILNKRIDIYEKNFIKLLITNKRIKVLNSILFCFMNFYYFYNNTLKITIISAYRFNKNKKKEIHKELEKKYLKKIILKFKTKKSIIDGTVLYLNDTTINNSIKNYLNQLSNFLLS